MAICPICLGNAFDPLAVIDFGGWETDADGGLRRRTELFDLGRCFACAHVMITTSYGPETFQRIYLDTPQDPVFWDETHVGSTAPYASMADFCGGRIAQPDGLLVDVGCGPGLLLAALRDTCGQPIERLVGIDFNRRLPEPFRFVQADLNRLRPDDLPGPIAVAFASHLLEHLVDPRAFLRALAGRLAEDGLIYVEVPDNLHLDPVIVGPTNLINQQHIHYFCEASLTRLAESCGLEVVRSERSVLGYVPRLRALLQRAADPGVAEVVRRSLELLAARRAGLADAVRGKFHDRRSVGLWGIGADFYRLMTEHADLAARIAEGRIALFDLGSAGRNVAGCTIRPPEDIGTFDGTVFLVPLLGDVRLKMRRFAEASGFPVGRVVDPWINPL